MKLSTRPISLTPEQIKEIKDSGKPVYKVTLYNVDFIYSPLNTTQHAQILKTDKSEDEIVDSIIDAVAHTFIDSNMFETYSGLKSTLYETIMRSSGYVTPTISEL